MKKKLIIITKNVFSQNDYQRFKISKINKDFEVFCVDCSKLFFKKINTRNKKINNYFKIKNIFEYFFVINKIKPDIILDQLGFSFSYKTILLRLYANLKSKCLFYFTGPRKRIPTFSNFDNGLKYFFVNPLKFLIILNNFVTKKIFMKINFFNTIFLLSSTYREKMIKNTNAKKIIYFHSNDYDNYLINKKKFKIKKIKFAVFIDENVPNHDDYQISNFKSPIDEKTYYKLLNNFFTIFEKKFKTKIVIALHPKSKFKEMKKNFLNRKIFIGKTQELIFNSKLVLTHCSTSRSYAILYNKPMIYLTSNKISKTWFGKEIIENCKLTSSHIINLDKINLNVSNLLKINSKKYKKYKDKFLVHPKADNILFENIFNKIFN